MTRTRRNALERKCLTSNSKILYRNMGKSVMKMVLAAERMDKDKASRKKVD